MTFRSLLKKPSAWLPIIISLGLLVMVLIAGAKHELVPQPDEGTGAHIFQLLMLCQEIIIIFFAIKWLPQSPKQAACVMLLQLLAMAAAFAPVHYYHL